MTAQYRDRVSDRSTSTGTSTITLLGTAPNGFRTFASAYTSGATVRYAISTSDLTQWEVGEGVWTSAGSLLTRAIVFASSNAGALVNLPAGTHDVAGVLTAADVTTHKFIGYLNAAANTTTAGWQKVPIDTVAHDTGGIWDAGNLRVMPTLRGFYQVTVRARTTTSGTLVAGVYKNGSLENVLGADSSVGSFGAAGSALVYCNGTTDYLEPFVFCVSVRAYNSGNPIDNYFHVVGPL